jgi:hypothetical protein
VFDAFRGVEKARSGKTITDFAGLRELPVLFPAM